VWQQAVIAASQGAAKVKGPCKLVLRFVLPPDRYPRDHPYGPDVDNLSVTVLDALNETIFSAVPGKDGSVLWLEVMKLKASTAEEAGLVIIVESLPATVVTKKGADSYYLRPLLEAKKMRIQGKPARRIPSTGKRGGLARCVGVRIFWVHERDFWCVPVK
jgi:hypothetical protein